MAKTTEADVCSALKRVKTALESLRTNGTELDSRIQEIKQTISSLRQSPISLEDFGVFLRASIVQKGRAWLESAPVPFFLSRECFGYPAAFHTQPWEAFENGLLVNHSIFGKLLSGDMSGAAICAIFPDQVCAAILDNLKKKLGASWGNEDAVPVAERRTLIASLKEECAGLEAQRSALQNEIDAMVEVIS